jgi:hypothetical protein
MDILYEERDKQEKVHWFFYDEKLGPLMITHIETEQKHREGKKKLEIDLLRNDQQRQSSKDPREKPFFDDVEKDLSSGIKNKDEDIKNTIEEKLKTSLLIDNNNKPEDHKSKVIEKLKIEKDSKIVEEFVNMEKLLTITLICSYNDRLQSHCSGVKISELEENSINQGGEIEKLKVEIKELNDDKKKRQDLFLVAQFYFNLQDRIMELIGGAWAADSFANKKGNRIFRRKLSQVNDAYNGKGEIKLEPVEKKNYESLLGKIYGAGDMKKHSQKLVDDYSEGCKERNESGHPKLTRNVVLPFVQDETISQNLVDFLFPY